MHFINSVRSLDVIYYTMKFNWQTCLIYIIAYAPTGKKVSPNEEIGSYKLYYFILGFTCWVQWNYFIIPVLCCYMFNKFKLHTCSFFISSYCTYKITWPPVAFYLVVVFSNLSRAILYGTWRFQVVVCSLFWLF